MKSESSRFESGRKNRRTVVIETLKWREERRCQITLRSQITICAQIKISRGSRIIQRHREVSDGKQNLKYKHILFVSHTLSPHELAREWGNEETLTRRIWSSSGRGMRMEWAGRLLLRHWPFDSVFAHSERFLKLRLRSKSLRTWRGFGWERYECGRGYDDYY